MKSIANCHILVYYIFNMIISKVGYHICDNIDNMEVQNVVMKLFIIDNIKNTSLP